MKHIWYFSIHVVSNVHFSNVPRNYSDKQKMNGIRQETYESVFEWSTFCISRNTSSRMCVSYVPQHISDIQKRPIWKETSLFTYMKRKVCLLVKHIRLFSKHVVSNMPRNFWDTQQRLINVFFPLTLYILAGPVWAANSDQHSAKRRNSLALNIVPQIPTYVQATCTKETYQKRHTHLKRDLYILKSDSVQRDLHI